MLQKIWIKAKNLILAERSPRRLLVSLVVAFFFAFSPFLGVMTWLGMGFSWLLGGNMFITAAVINIVNNPWTMIFIVVLNYLIGSWITNLLHLDLRPYDPSWVAWLNTKIGPWVQNKLGINDICFWVYIVGGIITAVLAALLASAVGYALIRHYSARKNHNENNNNQ